MEYNSGSNRASNFKSAEHVARGRAQECAIYMNSFFFPYSKHWEYILSELQTVEKVEKQLLKEPNSVQMIDACTAQLSDYDYPIIKSSNWTGVIGYPRDRATIT